VAAFRGRPAESAPANPPTAWRKLRLVVTANPSLPAPPDIALPLWGVSWSCGRLSRPWSQSGYTDAACTKTRLLTDESLNNILRMMGAP
jgi:hypothetical protein